MLTPGQASDKTTFPALIEGLRLARDVVERFFNKLKHLRRIATRFDKLARNYLAAVILASVRRWMRHYEPTT